MSRIHRAARLAAVPLALTLAATGCGGGGAAAPVPSPEEKRELAHDSLARREGRLATAEDLRDTKVTQVEELFAGRFPGVRVVRMDGGISVQIRGSTSLVGGASQPLYVIDGLPVEVGPRGLVGINPADIAKIEILKDAASLAFYGARGANGVVVISTKRP